MAHQTITHPKCGKQWKQIGNNSGHCSSCHETFYGLGAFDRHQTHTEDGKVICHSPAEGARGPWWQDDDGQWHQGKAPTAEQLAAKAERIAASTERLRKLRELQQERRHIGDAEPEYELPAAA